MAKLQDNLTPPSDREAWNGLPEKTPKEPKNAQPDNIIKEGGTAEQQLADDRLSNDGERR